MMPVCWVFVENGELCASGDSLQTVRPCIGLTSALQNLLRHLTPSALAPKFWRFFLFNFLMSLATAQMTAYFCWSRSLSNPVGYKTLVSFSTAFFCWAHHFPPVDPSWPKCPGISSSVNSIIHLIWTSFTFKESQHQKNAFPMCPY